MSARYPDASAEDLAAARATNWRFAGLNTMPVGTEPEPAPQHIDAVAPCGCIMRADVPADHADLQQEFLEAQSTAVAE